MCVHNVCVSLFVVCHTKLLKYTAHPAVLLFYCPTTNHTTLLSTRWRCWTVFSCVAQVQDKPSSLPDFDLSSKTSFLSVFGPIAGPNRSAVCTTFILFQPLSRFHKSRTVCTRLCIVVLDLIQAGDSRQMFYRVPVGLFVFFGWQRLRYS